MNHDLVKDFGKKLDRLAMSDYHGLHSPGLTCYLNSVLQVLFMTEDFREAVKQCRSRDPTIIDAHLGKLFADLQKSMANTHDFIKKLGVTDVYEQRDAAEYFEKILCVSSLEAAKIFRGELNHKTTCLCCKDSSDSRSFFWILPLALEDLCETYSVEKGLKSFFKGERFCGDNKMYCGQCNKKQDTDFGCEITLNPEVLTLLLKRFGFDYKLKRNVKLHSKVDIPKTFHMQDCKYELYAIVNHFGNLTGGHYTAQIKSFETQVWYHFDDHIVEMVRQPLFEAGRMSVRSSAAYLLMYRKVSRHPEKTFHPEADCTRSDVEAEGRRDEAESGSDEDLAPRHQVRDERCSGGETPKHFSADVLNGNTESLKERLKVDKIDWETQHSVVESCLTAKPYRDKPAKTTFVKNERGAVAEKGIKGKGTQRRKADVGANMCPLDRKPLQVSYSCRSSPSAPLLTGHLQHQFGTNEPTGRSLSRNSNSSRRVEMQCVLNPPSNCKVKTNREETWSQSNSRGQVKAKPWR